MPTGNYSIITRRPGAVLTALEYNTQDHQNHIINNSPLGVDGYSESLTQMQLITDPYPGGVESLALTLSGEIERLRYAVRQLKLALNSPTTNWYDPSYPTPVIAKARVSRAANQSIPNIADTAIGFDTVAENTGVWSAGAITRFTAPVGGPAIGSTYYMNICVRWNAVGANTRRIRIRVNGTNVIAEEARQVLSGATIEQVVGCEYRLVAGDYVEFLAYQDSGVALDALGTLALSYSLNASFVKLGS